MVILQYIEQHKVWIKDKLRIQQNNAMRTVLKQDFSGSSAKLHSERGVEWVSTTMKKSLCKIVYQRAHKIGPPVYMMVCSILWCLVEPWCPANQLLVLVPRCKTKFGENNMGHRGLFTGINFHIQLKVSSYLKHFDLQSKYTQGLTNHMVCRLGR